MTLNTYIIAADITLQSPMNISDLEKGKYDPNTGYLSRNSGAPTGIGSSLTRTLQSAQESRTEEDGSEKSFSKLLPVIPATTIRGKLRRAARDLITSSLIKRGLTISADTYNVLTTGMATTEVNADAATPEALKVARNDPLLNLFGGTSLMLSSSSVVSEGWPLVKAAESYLMTPALLPTQSLTYNAMTDVVAILRKNDVADGDGKTLEGVVGVDRLADYFAKAQEQRETSKAKKKSGEEGGKTDLRSLNGVEVVRPGLSFALRIAVKSTSKRDLGLMLLALQEMLREGQVGGNAARGMGQYYCETSSLYEVAVDTRVQKPAGVIYGPKTTGYEFQENAVIAEAVGLAQDYIGTADPRLFEAFTAADINTIKTLQA